MKKILLIFFILLCCIAVQGNAEVLLDDLKEYKWIDIVVKNNKFYGLGLKKYSDSTWTRPDDHAYYDWGVYLIYIDPDCNLNKIYLAHYITADRDNGTIKIVDDNNVVVFHTKSDTYLYGMTGYLYHINLSTKEINQDILFEQANWGWFPLFECKCINSPCSCSRDDIHHFSFAGYYEMLNTQTLGYIDPNTMRNNYYQAQKQHSQGIMRNGGVDYDQLISMLDCIKENSDNMCDGTVLAPSKYYNKGFEEGKKFCKNNPEECGIYRDESFKEGYEEGYDDCLIESIIDALLSDELLYSENCEASFNILTNTLYVPCLDIEGEYWLDLKLINANPIQFELTGFGKN